MLNTDQTSDRNGFFYHVYGLIIQSDLEIPELSTIEFAKADVRVRIGDVPANLQPPSKDFNWIAYGEQTCLIRQEGVARFLVKNGAEIIIDRREQRGRERGSGVPLADVRLFLLGSAMGALLHQRGLLPLHVSAVETPEGVWAFTGDSGDGKSTIAALLHKRFGCQLVSDDVSVLSFAGGRPMLNAGPRKIKLWEDAVLKLGFQHENMAQDLSNTPKFQLYLHSERIGGPVPLAALVLLERATARSKATIEKLAGRQAFHVCMASVYRPYMADWFRNRKEILAELSTLSNGIDVYRYRRQWSLKNIDGGLKVLVDKMSLVRENPE